MTVDLRTQTGDLFAEIDRYQHPIGMVDIFERSGNQVSPDGLVADDPAYPLGVEDPDPADSRRPPRFLRVAVAAAVTIVVLIGGIAWLSSGEAGRGVVDQPTTTVQSSTTVTTKPLTPSTTAPESAPTTQLVPELERIPASIIAEVVTPSSIGDATWTVYKGDPTEIINALLDGDSADKVDLSLLDPFFSVDRIATRVFGDTVGQAGDSTLNRWFVRVDWVETALLHGGDDLADRSDNGRLLTGSPIEPGIWEIFLFAKDAEREHEGFEGEPIETIARYEWTSTEGGEGWTFAVVDTLTGEPVGSILSPFPVMTEDMIFTVSQGETVELVRPEWSKPGIEYETLFLDVNDSILAYVHEGSINSLAAFDIWRSNDATNWENLGEIQGIPSGYQVDSIVEGDGVYLARLDERIEGGPDFLTYISENGIDWVPVDGLPLTDGSAGRLGSDGSVYRVPTGWVWVGNLHDTPAVSIFTSPDGVNWEAIDTSEVPGTFYEVNGGGAGWTSSGSTLFANAYRDSPPEERLWIVQFP